MNICLFTIHELKPWTFFAFKEKLKQSKFLASNYI